MRRLLRRGRSGMLATVLGGVTPLGVPSHDAARAGHPYASLVTLAWDVDASPIFLFSTLSDHTRNLASDSRAALLIEEASRRANPQTGPRVTLIGRIAPCARGEDESSARRRFLARHPEAARYAGFGDFRFFRMM
ncbi:MAG: pyridoxamine 5'-phosphate oxidase family protein, partial [Pseudomonadota bacterium]